MANPPKTPPHSDIEGVNRDARAGKPSQSPHPDPGAAIDHADKESRGRPHGGRQSA
ncbi:hypothetical protein [Sphingomonas sp.]|uniref:hypothetical protein n=1 Tax=Sphingomonas sp. TaxID=28214 RepID=UPI0025D85788|nr:hypothetical protein [Sphingomonas sp.]